MLWSCNYNFIIIVTNIHVFSLSFESKWLISCCLHFWSVSKIFSASFTLFIIIEKSLQVFLSASTFFTSPYPNILLPRIELFCLGVLLTHNTMFTETYNGFLRYRLQRFLFLFGRSGLFASHLVYFPPFSLLPLCSSLLLNAWFYASV